MCGLVGYVTLTDDGSWWRHHCQWCAERNLHPSTLMPLDGSQPPAPQPYPDTPLSFDPGRIDWLALNREVSS